MALNPKLIGESQAHLDLLDHISALAALDRPTLMTGERGTGKELFAARIHFLSPRWEAPYDALACASLADGPLEARLFGVENDGIRSSGRIGLIEACDGGTLFLDEITALSERLQERLLRVIERGTFERVGGDETITSNVRIIAATSETQSEAAPKLRPDLLDDLAFGVVHIPPLRLRPDDIMPLTEHFGKTSAAEFDLERFPGFTAEASQTLIEHTWPGNIRELKTVVGRSVGLTALEREQNGEDPLAPIPDIRFSTTATPDWADAASDNVIVNPAFPENDAVMYPGPRSPRPDLTPDASFTDRVAAFEHRLVSEALHATNHHQGRAAEYLGLSYHQFRGLLKKHGVKK